MHCPECGFANAEGANYCQKCGAFLAEASLYLGIALTMWATVIYVQDGLRFSKASSST